MFRYYSVALAAVIGFYAIFASVPATAKEKRIGGVYGVEGRGAATGPWANGYKGTCTIEPYLPALPVAISSFDVEEGGFYRVSCQLDGGISYAGKGMIIDRVFALSLGQYMNMYHINDDGSLQGRWIDAGGEDSGWEILKPAKP